jgi:formylmethanofuran dehydrogenase subunit A
MEQYEERIRYANEPMPIKYIDIRMAYNLSHLPIEERYARSVGLQQQYGHLAVRAPAPVTEYELLPTKSRIWTYQVQ